MKILETKYMGLRLKNPIIAGSCGLTSTVEGIKKLADSGVSAVVLKSVFEEEIIKEHEDTLKNDLGAFENNMEFLDYFDYQLKDNVLGKMASLIEEAKKVIDIPIIGSLNCATSGEWFSYARQLEKAGVDALELNVFKLPFDVEMEAGEQERLYLSIIEKVKQYVQIPVAVKIAPYSSNLAALVKKMDDAGADAITMFNRFYNVDFDIMTDEVKAGNPYSSEQDYYNTLRWVSIMSGKLTCDLSASTGIHSAETAIKMLMAGAATVQVVSKLYKDGVGSVAGILKNIELWMDKRGYVSIDEFRGSVHHEPKENSERFERVQFMRYFSDHYPHQIL
ncbi:dihydroorotate dehydrogenase-like protein [Saccharicrinis fermentans]|uniref:Dihydroorotate dehydrogenase B n=1 Tax=Saccharicrinis fermentans DSM 9555 = JCM 21142 TaxID=869213 RepID=W7Y5K5_9BACT|nr:dihydroorotate dehydrogenase-like protein [Saccharicrinis fermentans]GAF03387.1 dihydroorotate dehydrogenase B [Saccharicrinis fermentans DSM 9555 = JCM 21142]